MTKKKNKESSDVRFIRLTTGEDLVTEVTDVANGRVHINYPLKLLYTPSLTSGYLSISMMQWIFTRVSKNQAFDIDQVNVLVMSPADDDLKEHYEKTIISYQNRVDDDESDDYEDFSSLNEEEGLEMLKDVLDKLKNNKGSLH
jgi:hypothetical protein